MPQNRVGMRTRSSKKKPSMKQRGRNGRTEDARRRPDRQVLHWMPQDKVGMCKEAPGRSPSYSKRAGAKEPTSCDGGQTRQALYWTPQNKVGMRERSSKKKPSIQQGQELERPFKWNEDQNGIDTNEGVPIARIKARYTEQSPLMRNMTKPCQQGRRANGSSLLNIGAKRFTPQKGIRTSTPQMIGDEQRANCAQNYPTTS